MGSLLRGNRDGLWRVDTKSCDFAMIVGPMPICSLNIAKIAFFQRVCAPKRVHWVMDFWVTHTFLLSLLNWSPNRPSTSWSIVAYHISKFVWLRWSSCNWIISSSNYWFNLGLDIWSFLGIISYLRLFLSIVSIICRNSQYWKKMS